jgi:GT2 family glycosyltransferase
MLSVIVLSYNRKDALAHTLRQIHALRDAVELECIVVDNASTDGTPDMLIRDFDRVRSLALTENIGVAAFNRGANLATGETLLILDDDSWPDHDSLSHALRFLDEHKAHAGVALLPKHPKTNVVEWPFLQRARDAFPVMGCGNLVRTSAWRAVGGYEESFFLYRNDVDLAMKLLAAGHDVHADPQWIVWHDSPHAAKKSNRWLELATTNWVLLARRHARGWRLPFAIILGWLSSCRHAGLNPSRLRLATRGLLIGIGSSVAPLPQACHTNGRAFAELLRLQLRSKR